MTVDQPISLEELAFSSKPLSEVLSPGTCLRRKDQQGAWKGGEVILYVTADEIVLAPYRAANAELTHAHIERGLQAKLPRRADLQHYIILGGPLALDDCR